MDSPTPNERARLPTGTLEASEPGPGHQPGGDRTQTAADHPPMACVHELFEEQARHRPQATALAQGGSKLTYDELNRAANRLAHHLRDLGVERDVLVGIFMRRRIEMIIALLATLKAGGAYVPLDPAYPPARLAEATSSLDLKIVLTTSDLVGAMPADPPRALAVDTIHPEISSLSAENPARRSSPGLAYVVVTAGAAGKPRAAGVHHRGWTALATWLARKFDAGSDDRVLLTSSFGADIAQRSIALPLVTGGRLHLLAADVHDPELIARSIAEERITLLNCAPGTLAPAGAGNDWPSLKTVFLDGAPVSASRVREWTQATTMAVANAYGAAECPETSTFYRLVDAGRRAETPAPAARFIARSQIRLLDDEPGPMSFGRPGATSSAGDGGRRRSVNDNASTAGTSVPTPFGEIAEAPAERRGRPAPRAAQTPLEREVCAILADALAVEGVGGDDDFFDLGGDSSKATLAAAALASRLGRAVPVEALLEERTARKLCRRIETTPFWKSEQ